MVTNVIQGVSVVSGLLIIEHTILLPHSDQSCCPLCNAQFSNK